MIVKTKNLGQRRRIIPDFSVPPPKELGDGGELRLRDVIEHVVSNEVDAFRKRQDGRRFDRVLTQTQIEDGAAKGKINPAAATGSQEIDTEAAVATALIGFEDGLYLVILDEIERTSLDEVVYVTTDSTLMFVRLTFLAGA